MFRGMPQLDDLLALSELDNGFEASLQVGTAIGNRGGAAAIDVHPPCSADTVGYPSDCDKAENRRGSQKHQRLQVKCREDQYRADGDRPGKRSEGRPLPCERVEADANRPDAAENQPEFFLGFAHLMG